MPREEVIHTLRAAAHALLQGMAYDPDSSAQRAELGEQLKSKLGALGFVPSERRSRDRRRGGRELILVFRHRKDPGLVVNVYTSISDSGSVRSKGADAIRICTEYETKALREDQEEGAFSTSKLVFQRPLGKDELAACMVQRRGASISDIVDRVVERARSAYRALNLVKRCRRCQAPVALSKQKKEYCTETCWKK